MSHERLHHQKVHARFGERGAEGVPQGVGMAGWHAGALAVIAKDAAQPRRGEGLAPMWALRHDEQRLRSRLGALGEEIGAYSDDSVHPVRSFRTRASEAA